jgi:hypothetical protein
MQRFSCKYHSGETTADLTHFCWFLGMLPGLPTVSAPVFAQIRLAGENRRFINVFLNNYFEFKFNLIINSQLTLIQLENKYFVSRK